MNRKNRIYLIILVCILICVIGVSYAYWIFSYQQTNVNKLTSSCFSLSLTNELDEINLQNVYPISDEKGKETTPFKFTVKNTCDSFASYTVSLEVLDGTDLKSEYVKSQINREGPMNLANLETTDTTITNSVESRILAKGTLGSQDEENYSLRLWMDGDTANSSDSMNKSFTAKIIIKGEPSTYNLIEQGITKLSDAMLANEYQTTIKRAKDRIAAKDTPDFSKTAPIIEYQEVHGTTEATVNADRPHPSLYGNTELGAGSIDAESAKLVFGKNYSFDVKNANYTLEEQITVDPTTVTDYSSQNYYFCGGGTSVNGSGVITVSNTTTCKTLYKVNSVSTTTSGTEGTNTYRLRYVIKGQSYTSEQVAGDSSDKGLYQAEDDLGTSYYYRGEVKNNFVKFAGFYWRIIRRNGDGTVRLIYNGDKPDKIGGHTQIGYSAFNNQREDPAYVGYMYGNTLNSSKEETQANEVNSTMKDFLEDWYEQKLNAYDAYIADNIFCNDRSVTDGTGYATDTHSYYGPYKRLYQNKTPTLKCPQEGDKFTVSVSLGNEKNEHPIGLITADELSMAGAANGYLNRLFYLYTGNYYWSMSPSGFGSPAGWAFRSDGGFGSWRWLTDEYGVRAVINLKENVEIAKGIGTSNDPFVVKGAV